MSAPPHASARPTLLERLCLHRPELRAWALYDWANSAVFTVIITAIFPIYFSEVSSRGLSPEAATRNFAWITTVSMLGAAGLAPFLGALADVGGTKKRFLAGFMALGVSGCAAMIVLQPGQWQLAGLLFGLVNVGVVGSFVFYDALLPHVAQPRELDRLSSAGYALGYVGGGLLLAFDLLLVKKPELFGLGDADPTLPARLCFVSVAVWWTLFSLPLFRRVSEPAPLARAGAASIGRALRELRATLRELAGMRETFLMLLAFLIYNDGVGTIIRMATPYGKELGLGTGSMIAAILMVQFVGIPFAFLFGALAQRIRAKRAILVGIGAYFVITLVAWRMRTELHFYVLAFLVGMVQGGVQALSRSLFASMIPRQRSGEFFGLFAVLEKFAGVLGPLLFALAASLTGSSRAGLLSVIVFFVVGGLLLLRVDVEAGQRRARELELP